MLGKIEGRWQDEMVGWHHNLMDEFEQAPAIGDGQGSLARWGPWGCKTSDMTSDWTDLILKLKVISLFFHTLQITYCFLRLVDISNLGKVEPSDHPYGRKQSGIRELLDEGERGAWKSWLKTQFKKQIWHLVSSLHDKYTGDNGKWQTLLSWAPKSLSMVTAVMKLKDCFLEEKLWQI